MLTALAQSECDRLEEYKLAIGFVARYQLEDVLRTVLRKTTLSHLTDNSLISSQLIDQCVMTPEEQQHQWEFSSQRSRENPCCNIPLRAYSIRTFVEVVSEFILNFETNAMLNLADE
jgi:hypothetical protein